MCSGIAILFIFFTGFIVYDVRVLSVSSYVLSLMVCSLGCVSAYVDPLWLLVCVDRVREEIPPYFIWIQYLAPTMVGPHTHALSPLYFSLRLAF